MNNTLETNIGSFIIDTLSLSMMQNSRGKYDISNYIADFKGTQEELYIDLIKIISKEISHKHK